MKEVDCNILEGYVDGYADCIEDVKSLIPNVKEMSCLDLLNAYVVAMHLVSFNAKQLKETIDKYDDMLAEKCCNMCSECMECDEDDDLIDEFLNALEKSGFTVIKGGK